MILLLLLCLEQNNKKNSIYKSIRIKIKCLGQGLIKHYLLGVPFQNAASAKAKRRHSSIPHLPFSQTSIPLQHSVKNVSASVSFQSVQTFGTIFIIDKCYSKNLNKKTNELFSMTNIQRAFHSLLIFLRLLNSI